jgi:hypothetical protein
MRRLVVLTLVLAVVSVALPEAGPVPVRYALQREQGATFSATVARRYERDRLEDVRALLRRRAAAVLARNKAAFLADVDPENVGFRATQAALFDSVTTLPLRDWDYDLRPDWARPVLPVARKYDGDVWLPYVRQRYRLDGFDERRIARQLDYTFVRRGHRWYLASDTDLDVAGDVRPRRDPWDFGPIDVRRTGKALIISHADEDASEAVAKTVDEAIDFVSKTWGEDWPRTAVVVVAKDEAEYRSLTDRGPDEDITHIGGSARPQYTYVPDLEEPIDGDGIAGLRIVFPPAASEYDGIDRSVLIHEVMHVATWRKTPRTMPLWAFEGMAEWAGFYGQTLFGRMQPVADRIRKGQIPRVLPAGTASRMSEYAYDYPHSELLIRHIAERYDWPMVVKLYRQLCRDLRGVGKAGAPAVIRRTIHRLLGVSESELIRGWQRYMRYQLRSFETLFAPFPGFRPVASKPVIRGANGSGDPDVLYPNEVRQWRDPTAKTRLIVLISDTGDPVGNRAHRPSDPSAPRRYPAVPGVPRSVITPPGDLDTYFGDVNGRTSNFSRGRFFVQLTLVGGDETELVRLTQRQYEHLGRVLLDPQP